MDLHLQDKIIIGTGGARGIGEGISKTLAAEGAVVVIVGKDKDDNDNTVQRLKASGGKADSFVAELTKPDECKAAVDEVMKRYN